MRRGKGKRESRQTIVLTIVKPFLITFLESIEEFFLELFVPTCWLRQRRIVEFVFLGLLFGAQCVGKLPSRKTDYFSTVVVFVNISFLPDPQ